LEREILVPESKARVYIKPFKKVWWAGKKIGRELSKDA
jgi:hypothetical protein